MTVLGKQIWMAFGDMAFALLGKLDLGA